MLVEWSYSGEQLSWGYVCSDFPSVHDVLRVLGVPSHRPRSVSFVITSRVWRLLRGYLQYPFAIERLGRFEHCAGSSRTPQAHRGLSSDNLNTDCGSGIEPNPLRNFVVVGFRGAARLGAKVRALYDV